MAYYVNYTVTLPESIPKDFQAGPYATVEQADENRSDIIGYSYVNKVYITIHRDPARVLIGAPSIQEPTQ